MLCSTPGCCPCRSRRTRAPATQNATGPPWCAGKPLVPEPGWSPGARSGSGASLPAMTRPAVAGAGPRVPAARGRSPLPAANRSELLDGRVTRLDRDQPEEADIDPYVDHDASGELQQGCSPRRRTRRSRRSQSSSSLRGVCPPGGRWSRPAGDLRSLPVREGGGQCAPTGVPTTSHWCRGKWWAMAGDLTDAQASVLGVVERGESLREAGAVGSRAARQGAVDAGGGPV